MEKNFNIKKSYCSFQLLLFGPVVPRNLQTIKPSSPGRK